MKPQFIITFVVMCVVSWAWYNVGYHIALARHQKELQDAVESIEHANDLAEAAINDQKKANDLTFKCIEMLDAMTLKGLP